MWSFISAKSCPLILSCAGTLTTFATVGIYYPDSYLTLTKCLSVRWFECSRMKWIESLGYELGGDSKALDMCQGRGVSLILKSHAVKYVRPVTFPDTILVAHKPYDDYLATPVPSSTSTQRNPLTQIPMKAVIWSYGQRRIVTESDSVLVWYDYDTLTKCVPGQNMLGILNRRAKIGK